MIVELQDHVVHQIIQHEVKGSGRDAIRVVTVRCRAELTPTLAFDPHPEWSGWHSDVTCPACLGER